MTQEEKELLLQDLCARLPYGVIMTNKVLTETYYPLDGNEYQQAYYDNNWDDVPYLRPLSTMTEEEKEEYEMLEVYPWFKTNHTDLTDLYNWLNKKMFDYRGLIEKGLALEAPEGMYENR